MFEELPPESMTAEMLVRDLADELPEKIERLRFLIALDRDFGSGSVMLPGGHVSYLAYTEARSSFVAGNFLSAILAGQCFVENLLGGHLIIDETVRPIHGQAQIESGPINRRPNLRELLQKGIESDVISARQAERIEQLTTVRNPLMHFRDINDPQHLDRREMDQRTHAVQILEADARFALILIIELASHSGPVIGRKR